MIDVSEKVKEALRTDGTHKEIRMIFPNGEHPPITNENLIAEKFRFDEHTCSSKTLKFGLCEGAKIEFEAFDIEDVSGCQLFAEIIVDDESIPLGFFDVDSCVTKVIGTRTFYKVTAYNKLLSKYLDEDSTNKIKGIVSNGEITQNEASIFYILSKTLEGYALDRKRTDVVIPYDGALLNSATRTFQKEDVDGSIYGFVTYTTVLEYEGYMQGYIFDPNLYYRLKINPHRIVKHLKDKFKDFYKNGDGEFVFKERVMGEIRDKAYSFDDFIKEECYVEIHRTNSTLNKRISDFGNYEDGYIYTEWGRGWEYAYVNLISYTQTDQDPHWGDASYVGDKAREEFTKLINECSEFLQIEVLEPTVIESKIIHNSEVTNWQGATLRELQSATYEMSCLYGKLDRISNLFYGAELNQGGLLPSENLYPADNIYPRGADESICRSNYTNLLMGEQKQFRYLIVTYKGLDSDGNEIEKRLQRTVHEHGNVNYNMSDNWFFLNLVWSAEEVGAIADAMAKKMRDITWNSFELDATAMPYIESGDMIELTAGNKTYNSYILERGLRGIQRMEDSYFNGSVETF